MADILGVVFRRFASGTVTSDVVFPPHAEGNTLVLGDVNISRSVLFLAAVTAATDLGLKVLFFTQTPFQSLPLSLRASIPGLKLESLKNIKFVYVKTLEEIVEDIASLHELASPPSLIIVDGLDQYLHGSRVGPLQDKLSPVAHVAALLHDTAVFLSQILQNRADGHGLCRLMLSCQSECEGSRDGEALAPELLLSVLDRYLQVRCTLEEVMRDGEVEQNKWQVYLSVMCPSLVQEWHMVLRAGGALEFRPVFGGEQQILDRPEKIRQDNVETTN